MTAGGFDDFYRAAYRKVVITLRLATGSIEQAEDLAQEAFARTLARWPKVRQGSSPEGYVYRVAFRLHRRSVQRSRFHQRALRVTQGSRVPGSTAELWDEVAAIRVALDRLPERCRRAAVLCLYAELTAEEAATVLGISASTVRTHVQRARSALRAAVATDDPGKSLSVSNDR